MFVDDVLSWLARRILDRGWRPRVITRARVDHRVPREGILIIVRLKLVERDGWLFRDCVVTLTLLVLDELLLELYDLLLDRAIDD